MTKEQEPKVQGKKAPAPSNGRTRRAVQLRLLASRHVLRKVGRRVKPS